MIYPINNESVNFSSSLINDGKIIAYPTDTLYGFGVDATNTNAINNLNFLKGRTQPLSIIISSINEINKYGIVSKNILTKIENYLPGPYTLLLQKKDSKLSHLVTYGSELIGIRIPKHNFSIDIVKTINKPIITTSINKTGGTPLNRANDIENNYPQIPIFEDQEQKMINSNGSTIINIHNNEIKLFRQGDGNFPL